RAYYGIGRVVQMKVVVPPNTKGEAIVKLLAPVTGEVKGSASVVAGGIDLTGLFPSLWDIKVQRTGKDVLYAQLFVGEQKIGSPVVLQPLVDPDYCVYIDAQNSEPQFRPTRGIFSGMRVRGPARGGRDDAGRHRVRHAPGSGPQHRLELHGPGPERVL